MEGSLYTYHWDVGADLFESYAVMIASHIKFISDGDAEVHFALSDLRPPPTRPYSTLPPVKSSISDRALSNYFDQRASLIQLFAGTREAVEGEERHFKRVIEGNAQPISNKERTWLKIWDYWKSKIAGRQPKTVTEHECEDCGCEIPKERLAAVPGATRCVACQTKFEGMTDLRIKAPGGWQGLHRPGSSYKDQD